MRLPRFLGAFAVLTTGKATTTEKDPEFPFAGYQGPVATPGTLATDILRIVTPGEPAAAQELAKFS